MDNQPLAAHSVQEAFLYVLITPCDVCDQIRVRPDPPRLDSNPGECSAIGECVITGLCDNCQSTHAYRFRLGGDFEIDQPKELPDPLASDFPINPTGDRSAIIDLVQWVSLYAHFVEAATRTPDRQESRWNLIRAGECLDEALRFFDGGGQPAGGAVLTPPTRRVLAAHPERYLRSHLLELRRRCPLRM